jgi:hypothetical protein
MLRWTLLADNLTAFPSGRRGSSGGHFVNPALHIN